MVAAHAWALCIPALLVAAHGRIRAFGSLGLAVADHKPELAARSRHHHLHHRHHLQRVESMNSLVAPALVSRPLVQSTSRRSQKSCSVKRENRHHDDRDCNVNVLEESVAKVTTKILLSCEIYMALHATEVVTLLFKNFTCVM